MAFNELLQNIKTKSNETSKIMRKEASPCHASPAPAGRDPRVGDRQLNLAPLRATNWKNIQLHLAKY